MKLYISHTSSDSELASALANKLRGEGYEVFDDSQIFPGDNWAEVMACALKESEGMIVLLTPNSTDSVWMERDIGYALGSDAYKNRIIPVLVGDLGGRKIPWVLNRFQYIEIPDENQLDHGVAHILNALNPNQLMHGS